MHAKRLVCVAAALSAVFSSLDARAEYDWLQYGGDAQHSLNNTKEGAISASNVGALKRRFWVSLPDVVAGAPAVLTNVSTASGVRDLVFLTTMGGYIIALDAQTGATIWSHQVPPPAGKSGNTTSSPAVDPSRAFVYAYGLDGFVHRYAVGDGTESTTGGWPELVTLKGAVEKVSSPLTIAQASSGTFLYVPTGGYPGDFGDYQGHVTAINLATGGQHVFNTLCSDQAVHFTFRSGGGVPSCAAVQSAIWGRAGVVYAQDVGKIFMTTGNGKFAPSTHYWGDTLLALNPDGTGVNGDPLDTYTPATFDSLDRSDRDLGITSPAIFPTGSNARYPHLGMQGGKDGFIRLVNLDNLSGQSAPGFSGGEVGQPIQPGVILGSTIWTNPLDGSRWAHIVSPAGIAGMKLTTAPDGTPALNPVWQVPANGASFNGSPPLVANGVLYVAAPNRLRAFDAMSGTQLWQDTNVGAVKWQSPVVANGMLYLADSGKGFWAWESPAPLVFGLGSNGVGQVSSQSPNDPITKPALAADGEGDIVQVASGSGGSATLHSDGTVWTWGNAITLGDGSTSLRKTPGKVPGLPPIVGIATGLRHMLAVGKDGSVWAWGDNSCNELGPNGNGGLLPVKVPVSGIASASAGNDFSLVLSAKGEVFSFGRNDQGQLGQGPTVTAPMIAQPGRVGVPYGITAISAGGYHGIALRSDGSVWTWGRNMEGQLGIDTTGGAPSYTGVRVDRHLAGVTKIASGAFHSMSIDANGAVWNWGANMHGELGSGSNADSGIPTRLTLQAPATLIDGGQQTSVAVLSDNTTWYWGSSIGYISDPAHQTLRPVQLPGIGRPRSIAMDDATLLALMPWTLVPNLLYADPGTASLFLQQQDLTLGTVDPELMLCQFLGTVISSDPQINTVAPAGSSVDVIIADPFGCM